LSVIAFAKKLEEISTICEIIKFHSELFVDEPVALTGTQLLNAKQLLELVLEVKMNSLGDLSALEIYLEKNVSSMHNISSTFLKLGPHNQRRYTGDFKIEDKNKRVVILDDIQDVEIPEEKTVEVNFIRSPDITKAVIQFHNAIQPSKRVALRLALDLQDYATFDSDSSSIDFVIKIFNSSQEPSSSVSYPFLENKNLLVPARKLLDTRTKRGGFDIMLDLPSNYKLDYSIPDCIGPLSMHRRLLTDGLVDKKMNIYLWRARLILPSENPSLDIIRFGDNIVIRGRASKQILESTEQITPSYLRQPKNLLDYPTPQLLEDINNDRVVFFIGSAFLQPPRYKYLDEILSQVEKEKKVRELAKEPKYQGQIASFGYSPYSELRAFLQKVWNGPRESHYLLGKLRKGSIMITSVFDMSIEKAVQERNRSMPVVRGEDATNPDYTTNIDKIDLLLYKLLGDIDHPENLHLTDVMMWALRDLIKSSGTAIEFMKRIVENKTLILLGYDGRDIYDNFFRALINDMSYMSRKSHTKAIYLVNQLDYDNYYGVWEKRDEDDISIITLSPEEFLYIITRSDVYG
jgi:hypothetical protein